MMSGSDDHYFFEMNRVLKGAQIALSENHNDMFPVVYIVGVQRSGTTLLSQLLSYCLDVGYINNFIAKFWESPQLGVILSRSFLKDNEREEITFQSRKGTTFSTGDPNEFGYFWTKWLKLNENPTHHYNEEIGRTLDVAGLRKDLEDMICLFNAPILFKSVVCGLHASYLSSVCRNSLFIYIDRDDNDVVKSILNIRKNVEGDIKKWWSLKPSVFPDKILCNDPVEEVSRQVMYSKKEFLDELGKDGINSHYVTYRKLCKNPDAVIDGILQKINSMSTKPILARKTPEFYNKRVAPLPSGYDEKISAVLEKLKIIIDGEK